MVDFLKKGDLYLAPMSAYTDSPFRTISRMNGADVCVSEFVHCRAILAQIQKVFEKLEFEECQRPYGIQLFGSDAFQMADAASIVCEKFNPDFIDINYGCPAPNAVDAGAGASLLKDVKKMAEIAEKVSSSLKIPTTAKMRTGWNSESIVALDAAKRLQDSGIKVLALHGRTKVQGYLGEADWTMIERVASSLEIPVIGNGSVENLDASSLKNSACFGFMIGRASLGNPWIFQEIKAKMRGEIFEEVGPKTRVETAIFYLDKVISSPDKYKYTNVRSSVMAFLKGFAGASSLRVGISKMSTFMEVRAFLQNFLER